ncbi:MAG: response regulator [Mariprofundus sp.]
MKSADIIYRTTGIQMQMLNRCLIVAMIFVTIFGVINLISGFILQAEIELAIVLTLAGLLLWGHMGGPLGLLKNLCILHPFILFAILFTTTGGSGIGFIWSFGIPFIACMVAGARIGLIWSLLYAVCLVGMNFYFDVYEWLTLLYISLAYIPFTLIALFTAHSMEQVAQFTSGLLNDASRQLKHGEHMLSDNRASQRALLDAMPYAIGVHRDGRWIYCNPATARLLHADGPEAVIGTSVFEYVATEDHARIHERIEQMFRRGRPAPTTEVQMRSCNGTSFTARIQSCPVTLDGEPAILVTAENDSEREQQNQEHTGLKAPLEHAQRLESLGVLAGGIAHDFNNLLTAIMGNAELARIKVTETSAAGPHIDQIINTCDHAAELCKQMLAYAGKGTYALEVLNISDMIMSMGKLIRASVSDTISMKIKLDPDLPGVEGDLAQIQQLVLNFIINSADAIGSGSGEIKLSSGVRQLQRHQLDQLYNGTGLPEGEYVVIEVRDNGCGMDKDMQTKIFDPFFTTKEMGSGLGLSAVLGIVRGHHGAIQLFSAPDKGTAFRVYLPSTARAVQEQAITTMEVEAWRGEGAVLVVDDDLRVRTVAACFIEAMDFQVLTADDGKEGVEKFEQHHDNLVAVVMDMTMPVMGGAEAIQAMRRIDSDVPIILVSGYSEVEAGRLITGDRPDAFLQKPFKAKRLKSVLYEVMHNDG